MLEYKKYIESDEWYERSAQFLKNNPLCEFCGIEEATQFLANKTLKNNQQYQNNNENNNNSYNH